MVSSFPVTLMFTEFLITYNNILSKNIRSELAEYAEQQEQSQRRHQEAEDRKRNEQMARKYHHLISTEVIPGVFNSPFLP